MAPRKKSAKTSGIWNFYHEKEKSECIAICNICKQELSFKSTSSNLKKHMNRKHPLVKFDDDRSNTSNATRDPKPIPGVEFTDPQPSTSTSIPSQEISKNVTTSSKQVPTQTTVSSFLKKKIGISTRKKMDESLMLLFIHDFQPF